MTPGKRGWIVLFALALYGIAMLLSARSAHARDLGQWEAGDPTVKEWYQGLMQPDNPSASCCGEADAYWCDGLHVRAGKTFCAITDDRVVARRPSLPLGLEIEIPPEKLKYDKGNPTGHAIVFLSSAGAVYCFVQGTGI